jgi:glycosyltransferase involved in cell wall biosynthesis
MKILYLPCHSILEYDQYKIWTELGHEVYSMGSYINPASPHDIKRPATEGKYNSHFVSLRDVYSQDNLHPEQIEMADVIIIDHKPEWIINNWDKMKHKKVVLRTIGQSIAFTENQLLPYRKEGLLVVRYSPKELNIDFNLGCDAVIRFYKDPDEFKDWNGNIEQVITIGQRIAHITRRRFCGYDIFLEATKLLPRQLYGDNNQDADFWGGSLSYEDFKKVLRDNRCFFYTGTQPASYTLTFIEAMMTGIPIVAVDKKLGNDVFINEQDTYEVDEIIQDSYNGFVGANIVELEEKTKFLLNNAKMELISDMSKRARQRAIELFGKEKIKQQWKQFLDNI